MEKVPQFFLPSTENEARAGMKNRAMQTHFLTLACVKHGGIAGSRVDGFIHDKRADFWIYFDKLSKMQKLNKNYSTLQKAL